MTGQLPETSDLFDCQNPQLINIQAMGKAFILRKASPRTQGHLMLEYVSEAGEILAGQWFADEAKLYKIAKQTAECCPDSKTEILNVDNRRILLQPDGADRKLPGLHKLVNQKNVKLISHRPERRAVVRLDDSNEVRYAKIVKPSKLNRVIEPARKLQEISESLEFAIPKLLKIDDNKGIAYFSSLEGTCLYDQTSMQDNLIQASACAGKALKSLHNYRINNINTHSTEDEMQLLNTQLEYLQYFNHQLHEETNDVKNKVVQGLKTDNAQQVTIHRDFYDKQIIVKSDSGIGILDFDTLACGEPELDIANMLVHLELRALQGLCSQRIADEASSSFLAAYSMASINMNRIEAYSNATRLRLVCLYFYRPKWAHLSKTLLANIQGSGE